MLIAASECAFTRQMPVCGPTRRCRWPSKANSLNSSRVRPSVVSRRTRSQANTASLNAVSSRSDDIARV